MPKMKHASGGRSIDVRADAVAMYESQGWQAQAPKKTSAQASTTQAPDATDKE
jgi:hypothetical protein